MFLEISQNSQENTCARVPFSIKLQALLRTFFFDRTPPVAEIRYILEVIFGIYIYIYICVNSLRLQPVHYFCKKAPSQLFERVLRTPLYRYFVKILKATGSTKFETFSNVTHLLKIVDSIFFLFLFLFRSQDVLCRFKRNLWKPRRVWSYFISL